MNEPYSSSALSTGPGGAVARRSPGALSTAARAFERFAELVNVGNSFDLADWNARIERLPVHVNRFGTDPFGYDPRYLRPLATASLFLYKKYFRVEAHGVENIPDGRCLIIANHSGQLPIDGMMIALSIFLEREPPRMVRSMVEHWAQTLPFCSWWFPRLGQIAGTPENCHRLLEMEEAIQVFPEGVRGISKTFDQRYRLVEFGTGFMRLAIENNAPIIPAAVVGAEEQAPALYNFKRLAESMGMPALPITPTFPLLGPLGLLPYPSKYRIYFGEPMVFTGDPNDESEDIETKVKLVRQTIQSMLDRGVQQRRHVFW